MTGPALPIWAIYAAANSAATGPAQSSRQVVAFREPARAQRFIDAHKQDHWKLHAIADDQALMFLATDLYRLGVRGICVDPNPDGSGGQKFSLTEILWQIQKGLRSAEIETPKSAGI